MSRRELGWSQCPRALLAPANEGPHPLTDLAFVVNHPSGSHPSRLPQHSAHKGPWLVSALWLLKAFLFA